MGTLKGSNVKKLLDYLGPMPPSTPTPGEEPLDEEEESQDDVPTPTPDEAPMANTNKAKRKSLKNTMTSKGTY